MILSDKDIAERYFEDELYLSHFDKNCLKPASYDLHLGKEFARFTPYGPDLPLDLMKDSRRFLLYEHSGPAGFVLQANEFALACTIETVGLPRDLAARVEGKSSLGRVGLLVHATAGYIDPGFIGTITLELKNLLNRPIVLYPGMPVCQVSFSQLSSPCERMYGDEWVKSKYQHQSGPTASKFHLNFATQEKEDAQP